LLQQLAGLVQQHLTGVGERHAFAGAREQLHAQLVFELADVETQCRLGDE
jgi:hypothetical protein